MPNVALLRGKIAEAGLSQRKIAQIIKEQYPNVSLGLNALNRKVNGKKSFATNEIKAICEILEITDPVLKDKIFLQ